MEGGEEEREGGAGGRGGGRDRHTDRQTDGHTERVFTDRLT